MPCAHMLVILPALALSGLGQGGSQSPSCFGFLCLQPLGQKQGCEAGYEFVS